MYYLKVKSTQRSDNDWTAGKKYLAVKVLTSAHNYYVVISDRGHSCHAYIIDLLNGDLVFEPMVYIEHRVILPPFL